jgi:hypothetical protein
MRPLPGCFGATGLGCIRHCLIAARCSSSKNGLQISPSKTTHDLGYEIRTPESWSVLKKLVIFTKVVFYPSDTNWMIVNSETGQRMIAIDKVGTVPAVKERNSYPFFKMGVGDSFLLTEQKKAESARIAALLYARRKSLEWKFSMRKVAEGWRVIRIN